MPAAAKKTTAKKTVAKKTAAPRPTATEKAVEAALKVYKTRVADQVNHYKETGDLCDEEFHNIRKNLDLEEHLDGSKSIKFTVQIRGKASMEGGCCDIEDHASDIADALLDILSTTGVTISCGGDQSVVKFAKNADIWEVEAEEWD